jgi:KDO2-lipid IV(A) lauroyltransferase
MNATRLALAILRGLGHAPLFVARSLGAVVGEMFYFISAERRNVALVNLRLCFPGMDEGARRRLARAHFRRFAQALLDRGLIWWGSPEKIRRTVRWVGMEHYEQAARERPVILLAPHFVGLDAGGILATLTWRLVSVYSRQKNRVFDAAVLAGRSRFNDPVLLSRQDGIRGALRGLQERLPFYYLPDMDFGPRDAIFVPFFGVPAATVTATARLAKLAGAAIVPCVTRMTRDGYEARLYPAWDDFPGEDVEVATRRITAFIEERILEMPAQYLWTHKRFKTRPPGEARYYRH